MMLSVDGGAQAIFTSPITQEYPTIFTTDFKDINRNLFIEPETITLTTDTEDGKIIDVFDVIEIKDEGGLLKFLCVTRTGEKLVTVIIPVQEKIEIIDIYRPSSVTGEVEQIRLWVN
ncbi:hypothetical protein [Salinimicrobium soli]|uniref:hypothetical protein n=1 Tax=Salinimicrobium soli TaxID=1254399 RepID=UPI003AADD91B